jgi:hypothetical protein
MIVGLGLSNEVNSNIEDMREKRLAAERRARFQKRQARFVRVDEDGNAVMMKENATRGFGASSRDANYTENIKRLVSGGRQKGLCTVATCEHPEMELLHKCDTCKRYVHVICLIENNLLISEEGGGPDRHYCSLLCKE